MVLTVITQYLYSQKLGHRPQNCGLGPVLGMDVGGFEHGHSICVQSKLRHRPQGCRLSHILAWMWVVLNVIIRYLCSQELDASPRAVGFFSGPVLGVDVVTCCYSLPVADGTL